MTSRVRRIQRLLKLLQIVRSRRGGRPADLKKILGVSERTIFRDLELLAAAGVHCVFDRAARRYEPTMPEQLPPLCMEQAEVDALMLILRYALSHRLFPDRTAALKAVATLEGALPFVLRRRCRQTLGGIDMRPGPVSTTGAIPGVFSTVLLAAAQETKVYARYNYHPERKLITVTLHPYRLVYAARGWHLIAFCEQASRVQVFKLERFAHCRTMPTAFRPGPKINLDGFFGKAWCINREDERYHVRIRFSKAVSHRVSEAAWHKTQRTTPAADGSLLFEVEVDGLREILRWVLTYGDQAQVLAPSALRRLVAAHAERMRASYDGVPSTRQVLRLGEARRKTLEKSPAPLPFAPLSGPRT